MVSRIAGVNFSTEGVKRVLLKELCSKQEQEKKTGYAHQYPGKDNQYLSVPIKRGLVGERINNKGGASKRIEGRFQVIGSIKFVPAYSYKNQTKQILTELRIHI